MMLQLLLLQLQIHLRRPRLRVHAQHDVQNVDHLFGPRMFEHEFLRHDAAVLHHPLFVQQRARPSAGWPRNPSPTAAWSPPAEKSLAFGLSTCLTSSLALSTSMPCGSSNVTFTKSYGFRSYRSSSFDAPHDARIELVDLEHAEHFARLDRGEAAGVQMAIDEVADLVERVAALRREIQIAVGQLLPIEAALRELASHCMTSGQGWPMKLNGGTWPLVDGDFELAGVGPAAACPAA